jgi:D-glycero-beta-D-manno-heptose 1-phosphate adenylyltransferase
VTTSKTVPLNELAGRVEKLRASGKKIVATNGCFDLLHLGHIRYLEAARKLGDILVVGLNGDQSVRELKGPGRPVNNEKDRAAILAALEYVDLVAIFPELRATQFIERTAPDVYVKGGDYSSETLDAEERAALQKIGSKIEIVPFEKGYSTSALLEKLRGNKK